MRNLVFLVEAIRNVHPNCGFALDGDDLNNFTLSDGTAVDVNAVLDEYTKIETTYNSQAYARSRVQEYPPIGDQLDALFKAGVFPADMAAAIQAVKDKYPKGTA